MGRYSRLGGVLFVTKRGDFSLNIYGLRKIIRDKLGFFCNNVYRFIRCKMEMKGFSGDAAFDVIIVFEIARRQK